MRRHPLAALAAATALSTTGCQVLWASITSPSDWVSGLSISLSGSFEGLWASSGSPPGDKALRAAFRKDVRVFTVASAAQLGSVLGRIGRSDPSHQALVLEGYRQASL